MDPNSVSDQIACLLPLKGKVALLVPTLNSAATLAETLESIQAQGDEVLQLFRCIVIADGGSCDRTAEIAKESWKSSVPMHVRIMGRNRGEARDVTDAALSLPSGVEWFCLMHSDNVAKPDWLASILKEVVSAGDRVASVCSSYDSWIPGVKITRGENVFGADSELINGNRATVRETLLRGCWWHHSTAAIRVAALREIGGYLPEFRQYLDWDFLLRLLEAGWNIVYVRRSLMMYREHAESISSRNIYGHFDIWESFKVVRKHQYAFTNVDLLNFHAVRLLQIIRRMASSICRGQGGRLLRAVSLASYVPMSFLLCLKDRRLHHVNLLKTDNS